MISEYVEQRDGMYYVNGTRVMLDSIVLAFQNGSSPETIREDFPALTLEQVYGAIAFYLRNRNDVEAGMRERERVEDEFKRLHPAPADLKEKLERARERTSARRS
jgi:uncharacterized protein (DUF433 family)